MLRQSILKRIGSALCAVLALTSATPECLAQAVLGSPQCGSCQPCCNQFHCPPAYVHCQERPPKIKIKCGCPKPVCCPADAPNWGYFPTCWRPAPWGPNWSHCYGTPPAATVIPGQHGIAVDQLPAPRPFQPATNPAPRPGL